MAGTEKEEEEEEVERKKKEGDGTEGRGGGGGGGVVAVVEQPSQVEPPATISRLQAQRPPDPIHISSPPPPTPSSVQPILTTPPQVLVFMNSMFPFLFFPSNLLLTSMGNQSTKQGTSIGIGITSLNSRAYTNRISLLVFLFHLLLAVAAICFLCYKGVQGLLDVRSWHARRERMVLKFWLPPIEGSAILAIFLAFAWQKAVRTWPSFMVGFILWFCFCITMAAGILLLCFSLPATDGAGIALILFSIGTGLYACWSSRRIPFTAGVFAKSLAPVCKFKALNGPAYLMLGVGFLWISIWCFAIIGALNFYYPPLTIIALVLSLAWTAEVMRNVANLTVSRVIALYYLRGMQCNVQFSFQRAVSLNLGSACLGSLFVPSIEALRIVARALNLLEGEDEFMFSCAHCCLRVMECIFRYGNSWAFVHIAAYGRGFVAASKSTWGMFQVQQMEELVDSDITSAVCFLTGVSSGSLCVIFAASWTFSAHKHYTATVSLLAFFVGYLMTRIGMALPQACVGCYYVCYAENPTNRLFDSTIPDRLNQIHSGRDPLVPTPRFPRRFYVAS